MSGAVKKGDKYVHEADGAPPLFIRVTRVAKDQTWADITVMNWAVKWSKRQPLPIPAERRDWRWADVLDSTPPEWRVPE